MMTHSIREFSEASKDNALSVVMLGLAFALVLGPRLIGWMGVTPAIILSVTLQAFCVYAVSVAAEVLMFRHLLNR